MDFKIQKQEFCGQENVQKNSKSSIWVNDIRSKQGFLAGFFLHSIILIMLWYFDSLVVILAARQKLFLKLSSHRAYF